MAIKDPWEWLSLVDVDGPFLSRAALKSVFPNGLDRPYNAIDDVNSTFVYEHTLWSKAWTARQGQRDAVKDLAWRDRWVTAVLRDLLQWGDYLDRHPESTIVTSSPDSEVTVRPWAALDTGDGPAALVVVVDPTDDLRRTGADGWAADAIDRTAALLREAKVSVGLVTDGRWWGIVSAVRDVTTASGVFDSLIWREERDSRDAFLALAGLVSLAGGAPEKRLPTLFELSVASAEAITKALGDQVRRAVELVLQAMSESHLRAIANGEESPLPKDGREVYEAAVSVLMRVVFLLFAEERALLPQHQMYRDSYAIAGVRLNLERDAENYTEEALDHTWEVWHRLLAASSAIYSGASFEDARMPAYGGTLFDPARYPWLRETNTNGQLVVRVSDRVMLHVLKAVQVACVGGEARQLSFRDLDVEQIGYVYEGLLGYSAEYTSEVVVGLGGKSGYEPQIVLTELRMLAEAADSGADFARKLIAHLKENQPSARAATAPQLAKAFEAGLKREAADARTRLGYVLLGNTELVDQLTPLRALIRNDLREFPYVIPAGGLVMTESPQRANTGTHYTPRSLAEEVVQHALEPLVFSPGPLDTENDQKWILKSSTEILNLKVADIAVGSGAFLVAAARYLAKCLLEARSQEGLTAVENEDTKRWAIREVVAHCLYGADINSMAVEMCKLSLWLVSMDPGKPFSFVDDRVFHGNSLLGLTSERQLREQHIAPGHSNLRQSRLLQLDVDKDLATVAQLRRELSSGQVDDADRMRSTRAKRKLLEDTRAISARLRDVADGIIAAGLLEGGKPGNALESQFNDLADALYAAYPRNPAVSDRSRLDEVLRRGLTPTEDTGEARWKPLHWVIEAPDVFVTHGGFDAIIGNPPFRGNQFLSGEQGANVLSWLRYVLAEGQAGLADLCVYFLRRIAKLIRPSGTAAIVASNSIASGDNSRVGLAALAADGVKTYRAVRSSKWTGIANVEYSLLWLAGPERQVITRPVLDGERVRRISVNLVGDEADLSRAIPLVQNRLVAFKGSSPNGVGFTMSDVEAASMLAARSTNHEVLKPFYDGGLNDFAEPGLQTQWIVDFGVLPPETARTYTEPWQWVMERVKPERSLKDANKYPKLVEQWWRFERSRPELYKAVKGLENIVVIVRASKTMMPMMLPAPAVFNDALIVFATDSFADLAQLSSNIHYFWALNLGSDLRKDPRYTHNKILPPYPILPGSEELERLGRTLHVQRSEIMKRLRIGLTSFYNLVNDGGVTDGADVTKIREIHVEIDRAVMEAYGWSDIPLDHGFHTYRQMERFTVSPAARVEILDRLLEENHRRAALEAQNGGKAVAPMELDLDPLTAPEGAMF